MQQSREPLEPSRVITIDWRMLWIRVLLGSLWLVWSEAAFWLVLERMIPGNGLVVAGGFLLPIAFFALIAGDAIVRDFTAVWRATSRLGR